MFTAFVEEIYKVCVDCPIPSDNSRHAGLSGA